MVDDNREECASIRILLSCIQRVQLLVTVHLLCVTFCLRVPLENVFQTKGSYKDFAVNWSCKLGCFRPNGNTAFFQVVFTGLWQ